jgi:tRNA A-37 threonylcarbamoyl transferase component Bud32
MLEFAPEEKIVRSEEDVARLFATLPKELRVRWEEEVESLDTEEAYAFVKSLIERRQEAKEKVFTKIASILSPEVKEEVRSVVKAIEGTFGDSNYFVGNGSVAEVYEMPYASHVCVKYLVNPSMAREHGNSFQEEVGYMEDLDGFEVEGIRVPSVYFYHSSDFGTCFGMEKIKGASLNLIIENPDKYPFVEHIKKQDMKEVIRRYKAFVVAMHEEKKLVHRDITPRNMMVDEEGNWYLIDFGRAKKIEIGDDSTDRFEGVDIASVESAVRELYAKIA